MHEQDLDGRHMPARRPTKDAPETLEQCIPGDRVRVWVDDRWLEVVVANTKLAGSCWWREVLPDGGEGEFEPAPARDLPVEPIELRH